MATSSQVVDDLESSFQACLAAVTNPDYFYVRDSEEVKTGVEQTIQRFLDLAKQMECFFLQKRLVLSAQKPEQMVMEDNTELKNELMRKAQLLHKYHEKIHFWQSLLNDNGQQQQQQQQSSLLGPLAYLERTTSNIGMPR
ncbi:mediator of RNA polymerase II transcription subunit 28-like [Ornithodoros turicata]|uniref:mediator of RNA polymerase II transcription subunit 28-like n=1 Tax=Ornithodoros turicata TaxID=34597 RepID=UPI00313914C3